MSPNAIENFAGQAEAVQLIKVVASAIDCRAEKIIGESNEKVSRAAMRRLQELTSEHNEESKRAHLQRVQVSQSDPNSVHNKVSKAGGSRLSS